MKKINKPKEYRYQYRSSNGIEWTSWMPFDGKETPKKQQANGLLYEYR